VELVTPNTTPEAESTGQNSKSGGGLADSQHAPLVSPSGHCTPPPGPKAWREKMGMRKKRSKSIRKKSWLRWVHTYVPNATNAKNATFGLCMQSSISIWLMYVIMTYVCKVLSGLVTISNFAYVTPL
jgi:hypothetical protein